MSETAIVAAIRDAISALPGVLLWRNNSGRLQDARGRWVTYGLGVGSADLVGAVTVGHSVPWPDGTSARFFALEVKTDRGKTTKEQECWARAVRNIGGFVATVRSVDEAMAALQRCRDGATQ